MIIHSLLGYALITMFSIYDICMLATDICLISAYTIIDYLSMYVGTKLNT